DLSQGRSLRLAAQLTGQWRHTVKAAEGARHERPNLEGGPRETGRDGAFGHRMGGGIFNRDRPACTSVGKRSSVSPRAHRTPGPPRCSALDLLAIFITRADEAIE